MRAFHSLLLIVVAVLCLAPPLVAQEAPAVPPELGQLWLLGVGAAASFVLGILKFFSAKIAALPDIVKPLIMFVVTFGAMKLATILGVPIPTELGAAAATIVAALGGMGLRAILKAVLPKVSAATVQSVAG